MLRIASSASSLCASPRECCVQIHPSIYLWNAFRCARVIVFCAACPFLADVEEIPLSAAARIFSRACGLVQGTALLWWRRRRWRLWRQGLCRSWEACTLLETTCALIFRRHVTLKLDIALRSDSCRSHCNIHTHTHTHTCVQRTCKCQNISRFYGTAACHRCQAANATAASAAVGRGKSDWRIKTRYF